MIRLATPADVPRLVAMGERFLTQTVYRGRVTVNPEQMAELVTRLLWGEDGAIFVSDLDGVVGMIGMLLFHHPIAGEVTASEVFWWVDPEHRGGGIRLLKRAEQWAREHGAVKVLMIAPTPEVEQLYVRLGYEPLETTYQRAL